MSLATLKERVRRQPDELPVLYGGIDFDQVPERLALEPDDVTDLPPYLKIKRADLFEDTELIELMATATMLGDVICDAYVCLLPELGMQSLIAMLRTACREGIDAVDNPPAELVAFIESMEAVPDWIDLDMVELGAQNERISQAFAAPFGIRGAFLATFINEYAALPMAITGSLSDKRAAKRVNETATFFATSVLPGGMARFGPGFEAAAMVRLMHSMVRFNALHRSNKWDQAKFGIPIPQVDQMPAGLIGAFLTASGAMKDGRSEFNRDERAIIEMSRYRCFLLGLPEELLPTDPNGLMRVFLARAATLRKGFDDATCGELVRATMGAYLKPDRSIQNQIAESFERSFSSAFFIKAFLAGDKKRAAEMGVELTPIDMAKVAVAGPFIFGRLQALNAVHRIEPLRPLLDTYVTRTLRRRLKSYGHADFQTDASTYTHAAAKADAGSVAKTAATA
ncbi:MAG: DUF2236 domain-containing protein [Actinobacteria bacterium]|nr:DUF2236 domain-containing protein [Actinomycetota bacterium]